MPGRIWSRRDCYTANKYVLLTVFEFAHSAAGPEAFGRTHAMMAIWIASGPFMFTL